MTDMIEAVARAIAAADGLDWDEVCGLETDAEECNSGTCVAAYLEDHDPDYARAAYARYTTAAIAACREQLMLDGARLMQEAVLVDVVTDRTIERHGAHCRCITCELNITEDGIRAIDPIQLVKDKINAERD